MQPTSQTPATVQSRSATRKFLLGLLIIVILAVVGAGAWYYHNHHKAGAPTAVNTSKKYSYTYKQVDTYSLAPIQTGAGESFNKPAEFKLPADVQFSPGQTLLTQTASDNQSVLLGGVGAATVTSPPPTASYIQSFSQALSASTFMAPSTLTTGLNQYVSDRFLGYKVSFNTPQKLVTTNIKNDAMSMDFTATPTSKSQTAGFQVLQGRAVIALSSHAYYYFMVFSTDYNWQTNQSTWQQVINSLKIDQ